MVSSGKKIVYCPDEGTGTGGSWEVFVHLKKCGIIVRCNLWITMNVALLLKASSRGYIVGSNRVNTRSDSLDCLLHYPIMRTWRIRTSGKGKGLIPFWPGAPSSSTPTNINRSYIERDERRRWTTFATRLWRRHYVVGIDDGICAFTQGNGNTAEALARGQLGRRAWATVHRRGGFERSQDKVHRPGRKGSNRWEYIMRACASWSKTIRANVQRWRDLCACCTATLHGEHLMDLDLHD